MTDTIDPPLKRGRGRPSKPKVDVPKRPRGRPPKPKPTPEDLALQDPLADIDEMVRRPIKRVYDRAVFDEDDVRILGRLASIFCTQEEIASVLNVSQSTLRAIFQRQPETREIYEDGLKRAKVSLRRKQFDLAGKNHPMSIFLGKNYLGQKDVQDVNATVTQKPAEMSMEKLMEIAASAEAPKAEREDKKVH